MRHVAEMDEYGRYAYEKRSFFRPEIRSRHYKTYGLTYITLAGPSFDASRPDNIHQVVVSMILAALAVP